MAERIAQHRRLEAALADGPVCGTLGCTDAADVVIEHPEHGQRTVCADHADGFEVVRDV